MRIGTGSSKAKLVTANGYGLILVRAANQMLDCVAQHVCTRKGMAGMLSEHVKNREDTRSAYDICSHPILAMRRGPEPAGSVCEHPSRDGP